MRLSVRERNLVSIYHSGTRAATVGQLAEALACMNEEEAELALALIGELERMNDSAFAVLLLEETL